MRRTSAVENRKDRMEMAQEAGYPKVSFVSVLAGVLVSYGAFAVLAGITGAVLTALGVETEALSDNDWRQLGIGTGIGVALSLFLSYLFGGYVAGRMARRAGAMNGLLVFVLGILLAAGVGAAIGTQADGDALMGNLRSIGVPTSGEEYTAIGTFAGLGALAAMLLGSLFGGMAGERWHGKLLTRAMDPSFGPDHGTDRTPAATEVRSDGRHFLSSSKDGTDTDADADRTLDVRDTSTTLDDDLHRSADDPERTRTIRS
jgi:spore maturation protein SpmB